MAKKATQKPSNGSQRTEPVPARTVTVPDVLGGGEVRLYDAWKAGLPDLPSPPPEAVLSEFQWVLVHFPSRRAVVVKGDRAEGLRLAKQFEKGSDPVGLLTENGKKESRGTRGHVRAGDVLGAMVGKVKRVRQRRPKITPVPDGMDFDHAMKFVFPNQHITGDIERLSQAQVPVFDRDGNIVAWKDDFMTQMAALRLKIEHAQGKPGEKPPPPPDKKKVTFEELVAQIKGSKASRDFLRRIIDEADAEAPAVDKEDAS